MSFILLVIGLLQLSLVLLNKISVLCITKRLHVILCYMYMSFTEQLTFWISSANEVSVFSLQTQTSRYKSIGNAMFEYIQPTLLILKANNLLIVVDVLT